MPLLAAECTVLQAFQYSETSKILRLFTRDHGVVSAIARGALRPKSQYGGMLEPFTEGIAHLYMKHGRELQNLSGFELSRSRQALGRDLMRFGGASLLAEIVLRTASEEPEPGLYDPFCAALQHVEMASVDELESVLLAETWSLIGRLGFQPSLETCVHCNRTLAEDEESTFDYSAGGVRCRICSAVLAGRNLPAQARADLMQLTRGAAIPLGRTAAHWALLGKFLAHHVIEGTTPLRSLTFLAEVLERDACAELIVGTAGHIDHGKTALVRALTGIDTDRLPEEKRRGITIDLGFANLHLEDDIELGLVDVPGHEDFIRNMLAGATGIDIVMLVVAADEGVMPQTREHLDILSLLGVRTGIVVISKVDLVDDDWLELVIQDVRSALAGSALAAAPIAAVSATTGQGLPELRALLAQTARACAVRSAYDVFRLPVDRVFTIRGTGTVVTGTVWSGHLDSGASVRILPSTLSARVRGLQSHEQSVDTVEAGQRAAVALVGIEKTNAARGTTLVTDPHWSPASIMTVRLTLLSGAPPLRQRQRVRLHLGTAEVMARVALLAGNEQMEPGASAWVQLRLETAQVARARDRFVIRSYSPVTTIGGGVIVEPQARKRRRADETTLQRLQNLLDGTDEEAVIAAVELAGWDGAEASALPITTGLAPTAAEAIVRDAPTHGLARVADQIFALDRLEHVQQRLVERADEEHRRNPLRQGITREELIRAAPKGCPEQLAAWCMNARIAAGALEPVAGLIRRPGFEPLLTQGQQRICERILAVLSDGDLTPPDTTALEAAVEGGNDFVALLKLLEAEGRVVALNPDLYLERGRLDAAVSRLRASFPAGRNLAPTDFKEVFGVSRKYLIPLLEHLDKARVTARIGDAEMPVGG